jgi:hypothetical protein
MIGSEKLFPKYVGCDSTDISEIIDLEVRVEVPTLEQFHCYTYV